MAKNSSKNFHKDKNLMVPNQSNKKITEFVKNINTDEMRSGFLVTSQRKKLWNVQIGLINEFARICKKHNLKWFAYGGTMLGAVRHNGFIPWDDDVDLIMLRPDYEKFKQIAKDEIKEPYFLDAWYNYRVEDDNQNLPEESDLPLLSLNDEHKYCGYWPFCPWLKIRDNRTTMVEIQYRKNVNQGIWIDIFPLDPAPPFFNNQQVNIYKASRLLILAAIYPDALQNIEQNEEFQLHNLSFLKTFSNFTYNQKGKFLEDFMNQNFFDSAYIRHITMENRIYKTEYFGKTIYVPFEKIEIPIPENYDEILKVDYGDWRKLVISYGHINDFSVDIPYTEYFKESIL